jgi:predicted DNA-binding protein
VKLKTLVEEWQRTASERRTDKEYAIRLTLQDAARVHALAEMYPGRTQAQILSDLLSAALDELEASLPYVRGERVMAEDDYGDPIYEDAGLTPQFHELTQKYLKQLEGERKRR